MINWQDEWVFMIMKISIHVLAAKKQFADKNSRDIMLNSYGMVNVKKLTRMVISCLELIYWIKRSIYEQHGIFFQSIQGREGPRHSHQIVIRER